MPRASLRIPRASRRIPTDAMREVSRRRTSYTGAPSTPRASRRMPSAAIGACTRSLLSPGTPRGLRCGALRSLGVTRRESGPAPASRTAPPRSPSAPAPNLSTPDRGESAPRRPSRYSGATPNPPFHAQFATRSLLDSSRRARTHAPIRRDCFTEGSRGWGCRRQAPRSVPVHQDGGTAGRRPGRTRRRAGGWRAAFARSRGGTGGDSRGP